MLILIMLVMAALTVADKNLGDPATNQILYFKDKQKGPVGLLKKSSGEPVTYTEINNSLNIPLTRNNLLIDTLSHFNREIIPERIVHARGAGAFGYFKVTHDISHICKASFLKKVGKKTPVAVRFSLAIGERGSSDLQRGVRGLAIKFYTSDGNFDLITLNTPTFVTNDPLTFMAMVHALKRNPATHLTDTKPLWDFLTLNPVAILTFLLILADRGIPASYRNMPGYGIHRYEVENENGDKYFILFHILPDAGIKPLNTSTTDSDYFIRDLYRSIANCEYPSWTVSAQILSMDNITEIGLDTAFDVTKNIPVEKYPLYKFGKLYLNRNPTNYFAEVEQLAFSPLHSVPGIYGAPDKVFETRRLAYRDAEVYRLGGPNVNNIRVNCPLQVPTYTLNRDGYPPVGDNGKDVPKYCPNSYYGPVPYNDDRKSDPISITEKKSDNFDQASKLYTEEIIGDERNRLIANMAGSLSTVPQDLQLRAIEVLTTINSDMGNRVAAVLNRITSE